MGLETAAYINQLVATNPTSTDPKSEGDNHLRLIKSTVQASFPSITGAVTATQAELNILDGATLSTAELNLLDGVTATTAELNYTDGVTSNIQTQLDAKQPLDADLTAVAGIASNGLIARTGAGSASARTITAGSARVTVTNGDGVSGNPTIDVAAGVGTGDVQGPAGATSGALAVFDGATGKLIKAGGAASHAGSLDFSGTGLRLTGDFSNGTLANRLMFQTATTNNSTIVQAIPNGTDTTASWNAANSSDPANASEMNVGVTATQVRFVSAIRGTGSYLPMVFFNGGAAALTIDTSRNVIVTGSGGLGYGTGSGSTVTQATSKSTAVTLNKATGTITMNAASLGATSTVLFTFTNSFLTGADMLLLNMDASGIASTGNYNVWCSVSSGSAIVALRNISAGALAEAVVLHFAVIKGATT